MLEYGINRTGKIVEIEPVDQDIVRWTGRFDQGDPNQNFYYYSKSKRPLYNHANFYRERKLFS